MQKPSLRELFDAAMELAPPARAEFVARHCRDPQQRAALGELLAADAGSAEFFSGGAAAAARAIGDVDAREVPPGGRVGPFELVAMIGEGGSSTVFHACRESDGVRQDVALKILRRGVYSPDARRQFRRERQALAQLRHAGIARLIEGGVTEDGTAYIALELVDGKPITEFARDRQLDLRRRLELFVHVCRAVEAAHRALIVHRDLKPANVLVTGDGQVKLLDFGIAKLLDGDDETQTKLPAFTAAYAAPEQRDGGLVTTATDVYALGILLGEVVTGRRFDGGSGRTPSAQVKDGDGSDALPAVMWRALRGDLDNIVLKATSAEPERRYASAGALADDLERFVDGRPVAAHPPSAWYRTRRFVARHRAGVGAGAALLLALVATSCIALWQADAARRAAASADDERRIATREAARAVAIKDFLIGVFRASDPAHAQDKPRGQITARELLDASVPKISTQLARDPQTQIELLGIVGKIYGELGDDTRYQELRREQTGLARRSEGELSPVLIEDLIDQAAFASRARDVARVRQLLERADALIVRAHLEESWLRAYWSLAYAATLSGDRAQRPQRTAALQTAVALYAKYGPTHSGYAGALYELGVDASTDGDAKRAAEFDRRAIDVMEHLPEPDAAELQTFYGGLATQQQNLGDYAGAERSYEKAAGLALRTTGTRHFRYWPEEAKHARLVHHLGDRERAMQMFAALLPLLPEKPAPEEVAAVVYVREQYAEALAAEGRAQAAVPLLLDVERERTQEHVASKFDPGRVRATLADAYDQLGRTDEARAKFETSLQDLREKFPADAPQVLQVRERWARFLLDHGDGDGAQREYREVLAQTHDPRSAPVALAHGGLARLALAHDDTATARTEIELALQTFANPSSMHDVRDEPYLLLIRAQAQRRSGDAKAAQESARRALAQSRRYDAPEANTIRTAEAALAATQAR